MQANPSWLCGIAAYNLELSFAILSEDMVALLVIIDQLAPTLRESGALNYIHRDSVASAT